MGTSSECRITNPSVGLRRNSHAPSRNCQGVRRPTNSGSEERRLPCSFHARRATETAKQVPQLYETRRDRAFSGVRRMTSRSDARSASADPGHVPFAIVVSVRRPDSCLVHIVRKLLVRPIPIHLTHHVGRLPGERRIRKLTAAHDAASIERDRRKRYASLCVGRAYGAKKSLLLPRPRA